MKEFIYNACQETLTNSLIHGRAENITIRLDSGAEILELIIIDDGRGCNATSKNNGLTAIENRVNAHGGNVIFESPLSGGFRVSAKIPIKEAYRI